LDLFLVFLAFFRGGSISVADSLLATPAVDAGWRWNSASKVVLALLTVTIAAAATFMSLASERASSEDAGAASKLPKEISSAFRFLDPLDSCSGCCWTR